MSRNNVLILPVIRIERNETEDRPEDRDYTAEDEAFDNCGRWDQNATGGMNDQCRLAGTEDCELHCPNSRRRS